MSDSVEISILNQKFLLKKGKASETYIRAIETFVNRKMREIQAKTQSVSTSNVAILSALNIADDYLKQSEQLLDLSDTLAARVNKLIGVVDDVLQKTERA